MKAELCPVCRGSGELSNPGIPAGHVYAMKTCYGCLGKGWIEIGVGICPFGPAYQPPERAYYPTPYMTTTTTVPNSDTITYTRPVYEWITTKVEEVEY